MTDKRIKIGVAGTFVRDRILPWKGEEVESVGGLFFTVAFLANLAEDGTEIYPVSFVGRDFYTTVVRELARYPHVRLDGLVEVQQENTRVTLTYVSSVEREEVTTAPMPPLTSRNLAAIPEVDALIVNLVTGFDVELQALAAFRKNSHALIYLDFHSRALGIDAQGKRYYRAPGDWQAWVNCADIVQFNAMEVKTLGRLENAAPENLIAFAESVLKGTPKVVNITLGEKGSLLVFEERNRCHPRHFLPVAVPDVRDAIGCGDAFQAGFVLHYLQHRKPEAAAEFANKAAAANCTFVGSSQVHRIKEIMQSL